MLYILCMISINKFIQKAIEKHNGFYKGNYIQLDPNK